MDVMGYLIQRVAPNPEMVDRIWSKTGPRSALRGLIIEGFVYEFHAATVLRYHNYDNTQFLQDLIHYYQDISAPLTNQARKPFMVPCRYHVHEAGDPPRLQAHNRLVRAKFGMLKSDGPPGPMVADSRFDGTEHFGYTGTIPSLPDTSPGSFIPRQPTVADESESHLNVTDNTRSIPFINITDPESNTPRPPMKAERIESVFKGTGQYDNIESIQSVLDTSPASNVPRGPMVEEEPRSLVSGTGQFDDIGTIPSVPNGSTESHVPRGPMVEEKPGIHSNGTEQSGTPRSIPSNPDAWNPGCDRQMC